MYNFPLWNSTHKPTEVSTHQKLAQRVLASPNVSKGHILFEALSRGAGLREEGRARLARALSGTPEIGAAERLFSFSEKRA